MRTETHRIGILDNNRSVSAEAQPINSEVLLSRCVKNAVLALSLLTELEASGKTHADTILRHAGDGNAESAALAAHSLKGAAAMLGAVDLSEKAARVEMAGVQGDCVRLLNLAYELRSEMDRCLASIPRLRADMKRRARV